MNIFIHVCMYPCIYVCLYIFMHVCIYMYVCVYLYIYAFMYVHMYSYMYVCIYSYMYVCMYVYVQVHVSMIFIYVCWYVLRSGLRGRQRGQCSPLRYWSCPLRLCLYLKLFIPSWENSITFQYSRRQDP